MESIKVIYLTIGVSLIFGLIGFLIVLLVKSIRKQLDDGKSPNDF